MDEFFVTKTMLLTIAKTTISEQAKF